MKILFLSSLYPPMTRGGGEISTHYIARGLIARGHSVRVITGGPHEEQYVIENVPVERYAVPLTAKPLFEKRHTRKIMTELKSHIQRNAYDVIHAHDFRTALLVAEMKLPHAVVTARDYAQISGCTNNMLGDGTIDPGCIGWDEIFRCHRVVEASLVRKPFRMWQYGYNRSYRAKAFQWFTNQIFISAPQETVIKKRHSLSHQHTGVIFNPVDPAYVKEPVKDSPKSVITYVGTVEMYKGVEILLHAFRAVAKENTDIHLKIVGDGAQRHTYEQLVAQWGLQYRVSFTGRIPWNRLQKIYDESTIVVAPHLWVEPFGRTIVEAMARGRVVVAADVGGATEIIKDNETGFLFQRGSIPSLIRRLNEALSLEELRSRAMTQAARQWVKENLTIEKIAQQHEEFYTKLV